MPSAPLPIDEARRLATLRACNILDTEPEKAFDELVALAVQITGVPIAVVSLVDESRQWFKAKIGVDLCETPREQAFCAYAILKDEPLIVDDAVQDKRFCDNPLVSGAPGVRFYAGFPIHCGDGQRLGTLCVIDLKPGKLSAEKLAGLQTIANQVSSQLELRRALSELNLLRQRESRLADRGLERRATESFRIGQVLQRGMANELTEVATLMKSCPPGNSEAMRATLRSGIERIEGAARDCRILAGRSRDFTLLSQGWVDSVRADIEKLKKKYRATIALENGENPDEMLDYASSYRLAEFVQLTLSTILNHTQVRKLNVKIIKQGSSLLLSICYDDTVNADGVFAVMRNTKLRILAAELGSVIEEQSADFNHVVTLRVTLSAPVNDRVGRIPDARGY